MFLGAEFCGDLRAVRESEAVRTAWRVFVIAEKDLENVSIGEEEELIWKE